ncbi:unnamed protein product [Oppiella nova]|uniref:3-deoxy-7-phosphoheptulonate synthase n=1 Tax=Oppiella nova TaxID=334625 RepID=A0A7R9L7C1_9ACAR|nr:unnamed protein product [Oppiella nova]CAG2156681.1 unnamed protein product [Oppiella nova]
MGQKGLPCIVHSHGNPLAHIILRGSNKGTNYDAESIQQIRQQHQGKLPALLIDCSHGNSSKDPLKQPLVLQQIIEERHVTQVRGVMLESHLVDDGCLGWNKTEQLLLDVAEQLSEKTLAFSA